jgi:hypothetical protein
MHFRRDFQAQAVQVNDWIFLGCCACIHRLVLGGGQLKIHDLLVLHQEPAVNLREVENLLDGEAGAQGVAISVFWPWACPRHISHEIRFPVSAWLAET